ncbi:hypothetical protein GLAREA_00994 [Glarea lozoyensis ATCC 20868]|uniref:Uncharacterized protein n=1 Tax=Glarea lozoyensis (strain ATCC 20868 / MF5171) TaxID=1116229 RepID=S3CY23_GLAL2|nr:uncharacterized protein GLAREA_00994 [Glarea lozoyensis ATCC 20868]EPE29834.1 hypothetical protein GLAREA_00994 [Glarea lozoyensis ATCC 20868]
MEGTILEVLTQENPVLRLQSQKSGRLTQNPNYIDLAPREVSMSAWDDFNYDNIIAALGNILDHGPVESRVKEDVGGSQLDIEDEDDIDRISDHWFYEVTNKPLKFGSLQLLQQLGMEEVNVSFRLKGAKLKDPVNDNKLLPDWVVYQHSEPNKTNIVVGDSKCSTKWCSDRNKNIPKIEVQWMWPMRQIGSYCKFGGTRYSFIVTPEEIVVARFYLDHSMNDADRAEYKSIPWGAASPTALTMNLAIWALAMFALNEGHRPIRSREETLPLNVWWKDVAADGSLTYEHHLTGRTLKKLPKGGEARKRPTHIPDVVPENEREPPVRSTRAATLKRKKG